MQVRFGTDGVRGLANEALTAEIALAIGRAAVRTIPSGSVVIGRDTRRSGNMLEHAVAAGVCAEGSDAVLLGVVPTPAVAAAAARESVTGIVISASHNPFGDNGIKIFAPGGRKLTDAEQHSVELAIADLLEAGPHPGPTGEAIGEVRVEPQAGDLYLDGVATAIEDRTLEGIRVVVDCANGANSYLAPRLLRKLGADVEVIGDNPDGTNINDGFGSTDTAELSQRVVQSGADLGVAFDGDADRLIAVDHTGQVADGDRLIAMYALDLDSRGLLANHTVVVTVMSNMGFLNAMEAQGICVVQTAVGDRYVLEALSEGGFSLGGEQSGHIIFNDLATTGDGLLAAVMLLDLLKRSDQTLAERAASVMTRLPQVLRNVSVPTDAHRVVDRLAPDLAAETAALAREGRVLVRPSGTEPLVRIMVEASDEAVAQEVASRLAARTLELADD